jgi:hypothetical protein
MSLMEEIQSLFKKYRQNERQESIRQATEALHYVANELILATGGIPDGVDVHNSNGNFRVTFEAR